MSNRVDINPLVAGLLLGIFLVAPASIIGSVHAATPSSADNGFAIGTYYKYYSGNQADFYYYFYNDGFSSTSTIPEQIVLTASDTPYVYQIGIFINSSGTYLDNEAWFINGTTNAYIVFHASYSVSGLSNGWHTLHLHIVYSNSLGGYYVQYYLDGKWYNSWTTEGSTFDNELAPSAVIESIQVSYDDWIGYGVYGYLEGPSQTTLPTYFYGGLWAASLFGCTVTQTTSLYLGSTIFGIPVVPPTMLAVSGHVLESSFGSTHEFDIGDLVNTPSTATLNAINVNVVSILHNNYE